MELIGNSKSDAVRRGLKRYNGGPCGRCSATLRTTSSGACVACVPLLDAARRAKNPERKKQHDVAHYNKNKQRYQHYAVDYREANRDSIRESASRRIVSTRLNNTAIYTLDYGDGVPFYVGQTKNVHQRLLHHRATRDDGVNINLTVIEYVDDVDGTETERRHVHKLVNEGYILLNEKLMPD